MTMHSQYYIETSRHDATYWQTSFNTIESEETFLPLKSDSEEYKFFQTKEVSDGNSREWFWGQPTTVFK